MVIFIYFKKLSTITESLNLEQSELIKELGLEGVIYQANISEYETGRRELHLPISLKYAQLASVYLDVLADDNLSEKLLAI